VTGTDVIEEHQVRMAAVLEHLASTRRRVSTVADVLGERDRSEVLRGFVQVACERVL
jgi:hypothetical protein